MKSFRKTASIAACVLFLCWSTQAGAVPITWSLDDVTFDDGGIVTGTILFDFDLSTLLDWDISVSGGDTVTFAPFTYSPSSSSGSVVPTSGHPEDTFRFIRFGDSGLELRITPTLPLDGTVSTVPVELGALGIAGGEECFNCSPYRLITGGSLTSVPEPSALMLFGIGLLGLGWIGWRRKYV